MFINQIKLQSFVRASSEARRAGQHKGNKTYWICFRMFFTALGKGCAAAQQSHEGYETSARFASPKRVTDQNDRFRQLANK